MSKRYKGKDTHYRLQIKKDGEWQDLGLVASAEMDNVDNNNTTTTNFDEKYIHRNNDKNDGEQKDVKVTDLTFQTSNLGRTPKIIFENTDTSTKDFAEIYLDTQIANKSTLRFVLGDDKGGESNNETISFDWRNGEENSRATYYTFTESELQASNISAHFKQGVFSNHNNNALEVTGHLKMQPGSTICPDNTNGIYFSGANDQARIYSTTTEAAKIYSTTTRDNQINYSSIDDDSALNITVAGDATKAADSDASALNFLITDNNNDKINFRWSVWDGEVGASNNPINAYTFTKTSLDASTVTAKFNEVHTNTIAPNSDHTPITFNSNVESGYSLTINTNPDIESSIRYSHNGEKQPAWVVGKDVGGRKQDFGWWYNDGETGSLKMWLTQYGTLQIGGEIQNASGKTLITSSDSDVLVGNNDNRSVIKGLSIPVYKDSANTDHALALSEDIKNSTITITQTGISNQTFTLNGDAKTITLVDTNTWRPVTNVDGGSTLTFNNSDFYVTNDGNIKIKEGRAVTQDELKTKQDQLVSGTNIKTINGQSILGSGNLPLETDAKNLGIITQTGQALETYLYDFFATDEKAILSFETEGFLYPSLGDGPGAGCYLAFLTGDNVLTILGNNGKMYTLDNGYTELNYSKSEIDSSHSNITNKISIAQTQANNAYTLAQQAHNLASGRSAGYVFDTSTEMQQALMAADSKTYRIGDTIFLKEKGQPDYWISDVSTVSSSPFGFYKLTELESKIDLSSYQTKVDNNLTTSQKTIVGAINAIALSSQNHQTDIGNPHGVTKAQVGLSNVDNTRDLEKPISNAVKAALDNKSDTSHTHNITDLNGTAERDQYFEDLIDYKADIGHTHLVKDITDMPPITGGGNYINKAWMTDANGNPGWIAIRDFLCGTSSISTPTTPVIFNAGYFAVNNQSSGFTLSVKKADTATTANSATKATTADTLDGWHIDAASAGVDVQWIAAFVPEVEGNWSKGTVRAMDSQLFALKRDLENVKLTETGDRYTPVFINAEGKPQAAENLQGILKASVSNNVLTLTIL